MPLTFPSLHDFVVDHVFVLGRTSRVRDFPKFRLRVFVFDKPRMSDLMVLKAKRHQVLVRVIYGKSFGMMKFGIWLVAGVDGAFAVIFFDDFAFEFGRDVAGRFLKFSLFALGFRAFVFLGLFFLVLAFSVSVFLIFRL